MLCLLLLPLPPFLVNCCLLLLLPCPLGFPWSAGVHSQAQVVPNLCPLDRHRCRAGWCTCAFCGLTCRRSRIRYRDPNTCPFCGSSCRNMHICPSPHLSVPVAATASASVVAFAVVASEVPLGHGSIHLRRCHLPHSCRAGVACWSSAAASPAFDSMPSELPIRDGLGDGLPQSRAEGTALLELYFASRDGARQGYGLCLRLPS